LCHLIDLIYRIQGEPLEVIPLSTSSHLDGIDTEDVGMAVYKYDGGISFAKTSASEIGGFLRRQLVISGERGTIEINPLEELAGGDDCQYTYVTETYGESWHTPGERRKSIAYDRYGVMMENFADLVHGKENPYTYDYELGLYKLILRSCGEEI
jgi:predicted dehydrogenase